MILLPVTTGLNKMCLWNTMPLTSTKSENLFVFFKCKDQSQGHNVIHISDIQKGIIS